MLGKEDFFAIVVIFLVTLFVYAPSLGNGFAYDDVFVIKQNAALRPWRVSFG